MEPKPVAVISSSGQAAAAAIGPYSSLAATRPERETPAMHDFQREMANLPHGSDKIWHHGYHRIYPWFFAHLRHKPVALLEIGIDEARSLRMWDAYFTRGLVLHGIDKDRKATPSPGVTVHQVDQSDQQQLRSFRARVGVAFDIILDDGSHVPEHQILTLRELWPLVKPGGLYVIEDIETSYWGKSAIYGYQFDARRPNQNIPSLVPGIVDAINGEYLTEPQKRRLHKHVLGEVLPDLEMMCAGPNCLVLVKKDLTAFGPYYNRVYRGAGCVNASTLFNRMRGIVRLCRNEGIASVIRRIWGRFRRM